MRRRRQRHSALETAVFAAALLLSAFIARELWARRSGARPASPAVGADAAVPAALNPSRPPLPSGASAPRTEQAVSGVAPIKLTRVQRRKPRSDAVPAPR